MTKKEFYNDLSDAITVGCSLPFNIPEKSLDIIVKYAKSWFYRHWDDSLENVYILIPSEKWSSDSNFKNNRGIILPSCVYSIHSVSKDQGTVRSKSAGGFTDLNDYVDFNWGLTNTGASEIGMQSDAILGYVVASSWSDLNYHLFNYPISYNYNRNTNRLFLKGSVSEGPDFILDCDIKIPDTALFEEDLFFNYCRGEAMKSLSNILGTFQMELPGGASIDFARIQEQGEKLVDEIKEEVKSMNSGGSFIMTSGNGI